MSTQANYSLKAFIKMFNHELLFICSKGGRRAQFGAEREMDEQQLERAAPANKAFI